MNTESPLSVVLAGGGTAGHISPLLAIAGALRKSRPGVQLLAVGTPGGMEARLVPAAGLDLATISRVPLPRRPSADLLRLPGRMAGAVKQAGSILDEAGADVLVGVGGYVCTPMYLAARRRKIPIVVHEANTRPGRGKSVHDADGKPLAAPGYRQVEYVDGMETVYAAADLLLARAGAATVCEVAAVGVPAVFVPLPIGNGEQALNAAGLVAAGGALIVDDTAFSADWIRENIIPLLLDTDRQARMAASS